MVLPVVYSYNYVCWPPYFLIQLRECRNDETPLRGVDSLKAPDVDKRPVQCSSEFRFVGIARSDRFLQFNFAVPSVFPMHGTDDASDILCSCVSDPFLIHEANGTWHLFTRVMNEISRKGEIALSVSYDNLETFQYKQVVLFEPWDLAWPFVVAHQGSHFMVTSATGVPQGKNFLWLYESVGSDWPLMWERRHQILVGPSMLKGHALNPVLYFNQRDITWYLLTYDDGIGRERLFFSARIHSGYLEHPESQKYALRHAGPVVSDSFDAGATIWAWVQLSAGFNTSSDVAAVQISRLSRSEYEYMSTPLANAESINSELVSIGIHKTVGIYQLKNNEWALIMDLWVDENQAHMSCFDEAADVKKCWGQVWDVTHRAIFIPRYQSTTSHIISEPWSEACFEDCAVVDAARRLFANAKDWVIIILFNRAYIPMTKSWLCNTIFMKGVWQKTLFISSDRAAVHDMIIWNSSLNVVHWDISEDYSQELKFGQLQYFRLMSQRVSLMVHILEAGVPILLAETDSVWTKNALEFLPPRSDWDIAPAWDMIQYMMGFIFIRPTEASLRVFRTIHSEYESVLLEYIDEGMDFVIDWEARAFAGDSLMFLNYVRLAVDPKLKVEALDFDTHVGGNWYVERSRSKCAIPVTIQNNWLAGNDRKVTRMRDFGQWFLSDDDETCTANSPSQVLNSVAKWVKCASSAFVGLCGPGCIGTHSNGRFWARRLNPDSVVYSFGFGEDLSFEIGLAARYGVTVHLFDPSPRAMEHFLWVRGVLDGEESHRNAPSIGNMTGKMYGDIIRSSTIKKEQLVFHSIALVPRTHSDSGFCVSLLSQSSRSESWCSGDNCRCNGTLAAAQTLRMVMNKLSHVELDLVILDIAGKEMNVIPEMQDVVPRHVLIEMHEPTSSVSLLSNTLTKYNLVKMDRRYGTWKARK